MDLILWRGGSPLNGVGRMKFQSLFWWILYCDKQFSNHRLVTHKFQSLFWWILYCDPALTNSAPTINWFQSLFWWILYCDLAKESIRRNSSKFQSLFWWILYCDIIEPLWEGMEARVSILVLVDLILWLNSTKHGKLVEEGFNPCFGGSYIVTASI